MSDPLAIEEVRHPLSNSTVATAREKIPKAEGA